MAEFIDIAEHGGHWCRRCQRYVEPIDPDNGQPRTCPRCQGIWLRWDPPVPGFRRDPKLLLKTDPTRCRV